MALRRRLTAYGSIATAAMMRGAVRPELRLYEREALVEHAYLNMFGAWEVFLEGVFCWDLAGHHKPGGVAATTFKQGVQPSASPAQARARLLTDKGWTYLLWHNPGRAIACWNPYFSSSNSVSVLQSATSILDAAAGIRHHLAHRTPSTHASMVTKVAAGLGVHIGSRRGGAWLIEPAATNATLAVPPALGVGPLWFEVIEYILAQLSGQLAP